MSQLSIPLGMDNGETSCKHWKISDSCYAIQNPGFLPGPGRLPGWGYCISYLILGKEKALLIDTGFGIADLKSYVEKLTQLPLMVLNTHVHPDHSGGNRQFSTVYIGEHEWPSSDGMVFPIETVPHQTIHPAVESAGSYKFQTLQNGQWIELGDCKLQVLEIPGHTRGSIALYDPASCSLFSGDAIVKCIFYGAGVPLSQYRAALMEVKHLPIKNIFSAHWPQALPFSFIDKVIDLIDHFDPEKSEAAAWNVPQAPDLRMVHVGNDFDDPDFCALSFDVSQLKDILQ